METIYKYKLTSPRQEILLPAFSQILSVQIQGSDTVVWIKHNITNPLMAHIFETYTTGYPLEWDFERTYIGTLQYHNGAFVTHIFYYVKPSI